MATDVSTYIDLLPSANADKPNFIATLEALLEPLAETRQAVAELVTKYDVDAAVGVQLDVTGQWVGFGRRVESPIQGVFFSFDIENVGFDQGIWWQTGEPLTELVTLDDGTYRLMLQAKILANYWDGSLADLQTIFAQFFAASPGTRAFVIDNFDMTLTLAIAGTIPSAILQRLFLSTHVPFPPAAVGTNVIITSADGAPLFGFDIDNDYIGGFDRGAWSIPVTL